MTGFEKLKEEVEGQEDIALIQTVDFLLSRNELEPKFLNEEKSLSQMGKFIREKGLKYYHNGWNYITDEMVYSWAVMYYSFPNSFLKLTNNTQKKTEDKNKKTTSSKNNVISIEDAKKKQEDKKPVEQISLFGGVAR